MNKIMARADKARSEAERNAGDRLVEMRHGATALWAPLRETGQASDDAMDRREAGVQAA
jgi:hypothetical protein